MEESLLSAAPPVAARLGRTLTDRLELRPIDDDSVTALAPVFAKPEVWKYPFGRAFGARETKQFVAAQTKHWNTLGFGLWLVIDRRSGKALGFTGLAVPTFLPEVLPAVEVGWRLDPDVWGHGYATEAAAAALDGAFGTLGLAKVISLPQVDNPASVRVAERLGMQASHTILAPETQRRGPVEIVVMELTSDEWLSRSPGTNPGPTGEAGPRRARPEEAPYLADLWLRSRQAAIPAIPPPVHSAADLRAWFAEVVVPTKEVWLVEKADIPVALLVLDGDWIDQLYVEPVHAGRGFGSRLLVLAKELRPAGLDLWTFQSNHGARRFYERHGFEAIGMTADDNEERAPDVHYRWHGSALS